MLHHLIRMKMPRPLVFSRSARARRWAYALLVATIFTCGLAMVGPSSSWLGGRPASAQEGEGPAVNGADPEGRPKTSPGRRSTRPNRTELTIYVLTFTPGNEAFDVFGHNAIWVHDPKSPDIRTRDLVYNYGEYGFDDPALIPKFFMGKFDYWVGAHGFAETVSAYAHAGRGVDSQELDLTMEQRQSIKAFLEENIKPENKKYKYDYYQNNCATKVRDIIDNAIGGRMKDAAQGPARLNWRQHTSRLTANLLYENVVLNLVMGDLIDKPRTEWQESFIPMELQKLLRKVTVVGEDGTERPLVKTEETLVKAKLAAPPDNPPVLWPYALLFGALFGGVFAGLGHLGAKKKGARIGFGILISFFGFILGFLGCFFLLAWAFTDHQVGYRNENTFLCVPWAFGLVGMGINIARSRVVSTLRAYKLVLAALASTIFATVAKILPWFDQDNYFFLAFFIPFWGGTFFGIRELAKKWAAVAVEAVQGGGKRPGVKKPAPEKAKEEEPRKEGSNGAARKKKVERDAPAAPAPARPTSEEASPAPEAVERDEEKKSAADDPG